MVETMRKLIVGLVAVGGLSFTVLTLGTRAIDRFVPQTASRDVDQGPAQPVPQAQQLTEETKPQTLPAVIRADVGRPSGVLSQAVRELAGAIWLIVSNLYVAAAGTVAAVAYAAYRVGLKRGPAAAIVAERRRIRRLAERDVWEQFVTAREQQLQRESVQPQSRPQSNAKGNGVRAA